MLIAQISDTHICQPDPERPHTLQRINALKSFVEHVGKMDETPALILHTGDVAQDGKPEEYEIVKSMMGALNIPVFFALGNRDNCENLMEGLVGLGGAELVGEFSHLQYRSVSRAAYRHGHPKKKKQNWYNVPDKAWNFGGITRTTA